MYQFENMRRCPLASSKEGTLDLQGFSCSGLRILSEGGASGLVYEAISEDYYGIENAPAAKLIVKECYPIELASKLCRRGDLLALSESASEDDSSIFERYIKRFTDAFSNHASLYQSSAKEQIVVPNKTLFANGTAYLVTDASNGDTMPVAFKKMSLSEQLRTLVRVTEAISAIHEAGYVYLDLKPDNILCIKNSDTSSNRFYTGEIKLFDFDTAMSLKELSDEAAVISGSGDWSAHEQTHPGYRDKIGFRSDYYAIGSILFWMAVGRPPKSNEVIHAGGRWAICGRDCKNLEFASASEQALALLRRILDSTLTVEPSDRYATTKPLIDDLTLLSEFVMPVSATQSSNHNEEMQVLERLMSMMERLDSHLDQKPNRDREKPRSEDDNVVESSQKCGVQIDEPNHSWDVVYEQDDDEEEEFPSEDVALAGYEVCQMLGLLSGGHFAGIPEKCREALQKVSEELKTTLVERDYSAANDILPLATEMSKSSTQLAASRMMYDMADRLAVSQNAVSLNEKIAVGLERAIIARDSEEMYWRRLEAELSCKAFESLAEAGVFKSAISKHLSDESIMRFDAVVEMLEKAIEECDENLLEKGRKKLKTASKFAEHDMYANMITRLL